MRITVIVIATLIATGLGAALFWPFSRDPETSFAADPPTTEVVARAAVGQILRNPAAFEDQVVLVRGEAASVLQADGGFVLERDGHRILVYAPTGVSKVQEGEAVTVRGEVTRFTEPAADVLGDRFPDDESLSRTPTEVGDPYLLFRGLDGGGLEAAASAPDLERGRATLAAIGGHPRRHWGDAVTVAGEVVRAGRRVFVLAAAGQRLLIVPQEPLERPVREGDPVRAKGIVVPVQPGEGNGVLAERDIIDDYDGDVSLTATVVSVFDRP